MSKQSSDRPLAMADKDPFAAIIDEEGGHIIDIDFNLISLFADPANVDEIVRQLETKRNDPKYSDDVARIVGKLRKLQSGVPTFDQGGKKNNTPSPLPYQSQQTSYPSPVNESKYGKSQPTSSTKRTRVVRKGQLPWEDILDIIQAKSSTKQKAQVVLKSFDDGKESWDISWDRTMVSIIEPDFYRFIQGKTVEKDFSSPEGREDYAVLSQFSDLLSTIEQSQQRCSIFPPEPSFAADNTAPLLNNVAGQKIAKQQITQSFIYPVLFPLLFSGGVPNVLLYGPPGTGKTLIVKAATKQIQLILQELPFYAPQPSTIKSKYQGETEQNLQWIYKCAMVQAAEKRKIARQNPNDAIGKRTFSIVFFDEFEAIGGSRDNERSNSSESTVTTILQIMQGIAKQNLVVFMAATNFPWKLDSAVQRRFGVEIFVDLPRDDEIKFLIGQTLAERYSTPAAFYVVDGDKKYREAIHMDSWWDNIKQDIKPDAQFMKNLEYFNPGIKLQDKINQWAIRLGPCQRAKAFLDDVVSKSPKWNEASLPTIRNEIAVESNRNRANGFWFGYSGSDIKSKIFDVAITKSSSAAVRSSKCVSARLKNGGVSGYVVCDTDQSGSNTEWDSTIASVNPIKSSGQVKDIVVDTVWSCKLDTDIVDRQILDARPSYTLGNYMDMYLYARAQRNPNDVGE